MQEVYGDAFELLKNPGYTGLCITSNGFVKNNGCAVMGAGIAKRIQTYLPKFPKALGEQLTLKGNHVWHMFTLVYNKKKPPVVHKKIFTFPVKYNWYEDANIDLIKRSCKELMTKIKDTDIILLPRPGCGNGRLLWENVKPEIAPLLDNRVHIVTYKKEKI